MVKLLLGLFVLGAIMIMMPFFIGIFKMLWEDFHPFTAFISTVGWIMCISALLIPFVVYILI